MSPSHGTEYCARVPERAEERGEEHHLGEDEPAHAQRNETSTCVLYSPPSLSRITVPNQPNSMYRSMQNADRERDPARAVAVEPRSTAPSAMKKSAVEPMTGQCDGGAK